MRLFLAAACVVLVSAVASAQTPDPGRAAFVSRCAGCHGSDGNGGELGPGHCDARAVADRRGSDDAASDRGCRPPACRRFANLTDDRDRRSDPLSAHAAAAQRFRTGRATTVTLAGGRSLDGPGPQSERATTCSCSATIARSTCCARPASEYRAVTSQADWPSYNGQTTGSRYSPLTQITKGNAGAAGAEVDLQPAEHVAAAGDAGRRRTA